MSQTNYLHDFKPAKLEDQDYLLISGYLRRHGFTLEIRNLDVVYVVKKCLSIQYVLNLPPESPIVDHKSNKTEITCNDNPNILILDTIITNEFGLDSKTKKTKKGQYWGIDIKFIQTYCKQYKNMFNCIGIMGINKEKYYKLIDFHRKKNIELNKKIECNFSNDKNIYNDFDVLKECLFFIRNINISKPDVDVDMINHDDDDITVEEKDISYFLLDCVRTGIRTTKDSQAASIDTGNMTDDEKTNKLYTYTDQFRVKSKTITKDENDGILGLRITSKTFIRSSTGRGVLHSLGSKWIQAKNRVTQLFLSASKFFYEFENQDLRGLLNLDIEKYNYFVFIEYPQCVCNSDQANGDKKRGIVVNVNVN